jgi:EmrB/QacA subfamily drug resistance transporter
MTGADRDPPYFFCTQKRNFFPSDIVYSFLIHHRLAEEGEGMEVSSRGRWLVLLSVGVGTFMSALDSSVVNTILPVIRDVLASDVATIEWVVTVYLLVVSGLLLTFGRLGDMRGHKSIYTWGFAVFVSGSALCGMSPGASWLIGFRAAQALGAAAIFANSPAILTKNFPPDRRGQALGLQAAMTYLGLTVGPSLGGWLAHSFSWRAVFFINVPVGFLALALAVIFIPQDAGSKNRQQFDLAGAAVFVSGLVSLLLGLNQGSRWGWGSLRIVGLLAFSIMALAGFVVLERRNVFPMLDLSLFQRRVFSSAAAAAVLNYMALYGIVFLMPFYLIQGRGLNAAHAGLLLTAQPIAMAVAAPLSGSLSDRIGSRLLATLGMALLAAALALLALAGPTTPLRLLAAFLSLAGLGTGMFISPNTSALMGDAPRDRQGIASGILATARNLGMVLGVGTAGAILTSMTAHEVGGAIYGAVRVGFVSAGAFALFASVISSLRGKK